MTAHTPDRFKPEALAEEAVEKFLKTARPASIAWMAATEAFRIGFNLYKGFTPQQCDLMWQCFQVTKYTSMLEASLDIQEWIDEHKGCTKADLDLFIARFSKRAAIEAQKSAERLDNLQELFPRPSPTKE